ncbi:hypothetical protein RD792_016230 [Penstemon davidsonii]|uniref:Polyadenylate-binding protein n=1 Tax=Penstemon davidsonii TaxID=160366 RepID=A0ABR0CKE5_9LAMI|nr:hypothetical protein RD792_016230 [Penstemon davidsonii]
MAAEINNGVTEIAAQSVTALYVGDLDLTVTEEDLLRLFSESGGEVSSVKICIDGTTQTSLGYGYVNFTNPQHAAKALEELNFTPLNGKRIRVSYSNRDASLRRSGAGNIYIKNLDKTIDHKALHDKFSSYGNIISCKVETDASGNSKGYGFVQYDTAEAAQEAIEKLNGATFHGKKLYVGPFVSKQDRENTADKTKFTNVFVKNLSESTIEEDLKTKFGEFGFVNSVAVMRDESGNSKCFGFVNFEKAEDAVRSVELLNGHVFDGKEWYVGRAQKKSEREQELRIRHERIAKEAHARSLGLNNLYVKNLDDGIDGEKLKELFSSFGTITSCKLMYDPKGISKGSGFVAFSTSQEASRALSEMNGKMIGSKPLYVAIAERKEDRKARLEAMFSSMLPNTIFPTVTPHMPLYPPASDQGLGQQIFYRPAPPAILPPTPRFGFFPGMRPPGAFIPNILPPLVQQGVGPSGIRVRADIALPSQLQVPMMHHQMLARQNAYHVAAASGYGMANVRPVHDNRMSRPMPIGALASALANASRAEQRMILGENLYPLVEQLEHDMAAKVTGMLLEMDQTEVLHLLESPEALQAKVAEAVEVVRNASQQQASSTSAEQLASLSLAE